MSLNVVVAVLFYVVPLLLLIFICLCCALVRENRRSRANIINQQNIPRQITTVEQCSRTNSFSLPPPPYNAESFSNVEESLPSYERAINRPL